MIELGNLENLKVCLKVMQTAVGINEELIINEFNIKRILHEFDYNIKADLAS